MPESRRCRRRVVSGMVMPGSQGRVLRHGTDDGIGGDAHRRDRSRRGLDETTNGLIPVLLLRVRQLDGREQALARITAPELQHPLNEADGAHAARGDGRIGPRAERRPDAFTLAQQAVHKALLACGRRGFARTRRVVAGRHNFRRLATRYDNKFVYYQAFLYAACMLITLRQF